MPDVDKAKTESPIMQQLADGANLALKAQTEVKLYRCCAIRISPVHRGPCEIKDIEFIVSTSAESAKLEYIKKNGSKLTDDVTGSWIVGAKAQSLGLS